LLVSTISKINIISEQESPAVVTKEQADVSLSKEDEDTSDNSEIDFDLSSFSLKVNYLKKNQNRPN
jgi:hypothetical protein